MEYTETNKVKTSQLKDLVLDQSRVEQIKAQINAFLEEAKTDDIYQAMKDSDFSKSYAVQRLKELFEESMNSEKENYIDHLESQLSEHKDHLLSLQDELQYFKETISNYQNAKLLHEQESNRYRKDIESLTLALQKSKKLEETESLAKSLHDELEKSKIQISKFKQETDRLNKEIERLNEIDCERTNDYQDLITHIKSLQNDKECLQQELEEMAEFQHTIKESKIILENEKESLASRTLRIQNALNEEKISNEEMISNITQSFKEKSKKFKSKIIEQKKKLEYSQQEIQKLTQTIEKTRKFGEVKIRELEDVILKDSVKYKELEIFMQKQRFDYDFELSKIKQDYENYVEAKLSEARENADAQFSRTLEREQSTKEELAKKIKNLESLNSELKQNKDELASQLCSALDSLEKLRQGYSEQLSFSGTVENENIQLSSMIKKLQNDLMSKDQVCAETQRLLAEEQERCAEEKEIRLSLEAELKKMQETAWRINDEYDMAENHHKTLSRNYENAISEYRSSLQTENDRLVGSLEKIRRLEDYSKTLEDQVYFMKTKSQRKSLRPSNLRSSVKKISKNIKDLQKFVYKEIHSLQIFTKELIEKLTYKLIEKNSENRKLKSQLALVKKENQTLSSSVSNCSKEFDELSKEIMVKQKILKNTREQLKEKYKSKCKKIESKCSQLEKEKKTMESELSRTKSMLQGEIEFIKSKGRASFFSDHEKCNEEISLREKRISELEIFLEAERAQKTQLLSLKNKEIDDLTERFLTLKYDYQTKFQNRS